MIFICSFNLTDNSTNAYEAFIRTQYDGSVAEVRKTTPTMSIPSGYQVDREQFMFSVNYDYWYTNGQNKSNLDSSRRFYEFMIINKTSTYEEMDAISKELEYKYFGIGSPPQSTTAPFTSSQLHTMATVYTPVVTPSFPLYPNVTSQSLNNIQMTRAFIGTDSPTTEPLDPDKEYAVVVVTQVQDAQFRAMYTSTTQGALESTISWVANHASYNDPTTLPGARIASQYAVLGTGTGIAGVSSYRCQGPHGAYIQHEPTSPEKNVTQMTVYGTFYMTTSNSSGNYNGFFSIGKNQYQDVAVNFVKGSNTLVISSYTANNMNVNIQSTTLINAVSTVALVVDFSNGDDGLGNNHDFRVYAKESGAWVFKGGVNAPTDHARHLGDGTVTIFRQQSHWTHGAPVNSGNSDNSLVGGMTIYSGHALTPNQLDNPTQTVLSTQSVTWNTNTLTIPRVSHIDVNAFEVTGAQLTVTDGYALTNKVDPFESVWLFAVIPPAPVVVQPESVEIRIFLTEYAHVQDHALITGLFLYNTSDSTDITNVQHDPTKRVPYTVDYITSTLVGYTNTTYVSNTSWNLPWNTQMAPNFFSIDEPAVSTSNPVIRITTTDDVRQILLFHYREAYKGSYRFEMWKDDVKMAEVSSTKTNNIQNAGGDFISAYNDNAHATGIFDIETEVVAPATPLQLQTMATQFSLLHADGETYRKFTNIATFQSLKDVTLTHAYAGYEDSTAVAVVSGQEYVVGVVGYQNGQYLANTTQGKGSARSTWAQLDPYFHAQPTIAPDDGAIGYKLIWYQGTTVSEIQKFETTNAYGTLSAQAPAYDSDGRLYAFTEKGRFVNASYLNEIITPGATYTHRNSSIFVVISNLQDTPTKRRYLIGHGGGYYSNQMDRAILFKWNDTDNTLIYYYSRVSNDTSPIESTAVSFDNTTPFVTNVEVEDNTSSGEGYTLRIYHNSILCLTYVETSGYVYRYTDSTNDQPTRSALFNNGVEHQAVLKDASYLNAGDIVGFRKILTETERDSVVSLLYQTYGIPSVPMYTETSYEAWVPIQPPTGIQTQADASNSTRSVSETFVDIFDYLSANVQQQTSHPKGLHQLVLHNGDKIYTPNDDLTIVSGKLFDGDINPGNYCQFRPSESEGSTNMYRFYYEPVHDVLVNRLTIYLGTGGGEQFYDLFVYDGTSASSVTGLNPSSVPRNLSTSGTSWSFDTVTIGPGKPLRIRLGEVNARCYLCEMKLEYI